MNTHQTNDERVKLDLESRFNEALCLRNQDDLDGARAILLQLFKEFPERPGISGVIGSLYLHEKRYVEAKDWYVRAVRLSPRSELASLGLFHSLFGCGERDAAFSEMKRFLEFGTSEEYDQLLSELESSTDHIS